jgi:hypothetical protein
MTVTGSQYVDIKSQKVLGLTDLQTLLFQYLKDLAMESAKYSFQYGNRFLTPDGITIAADGNDKIKITKDVSDVVGVDGEGNLLDIDQTTRTGIQFENTNTTVYDVAIKHCSHPVGIQVNPRTGAPQYEKFEEQIGEAAAPDAVVDNGTNITFTVNSVTEDNVDNTGRVVLVWLVTPANGATTEAIAIESATVAYVSTDNKITTTGLLGQTTVSTTPADYMCACLGPTVKKNTDLKVATGYAFIGTVTGVGAGSPPTVFSHTDQVVYETLLGMLANGFKSDVIPFADDTYDLGESAKRWKDLYIDGVAYIDELVINQWVKTSLGPDGAGTRDLGSASLYWDDAYVDALFYKSQATFDDHDDLALIEQFEPTGKMVKRDKGGVVREIQESDQSSLPWPMLGPKNKKGEQFISLPDSTGFFLGAIKQLYKKHKEKTKKLEDTVASLASRLEALEKA